MTKPAAFLASDSALLAMDRSVRTIDKDGRLHVALTNISKACVNPYRGEEIPKWEELGLDRNRIYNLLRDPEELARAAETSNGIQLLQKHIPVSADDHQPWDVVGSVGTDAVFEDPYLKNSITVWAKSAIDEIESEEKKELSCGYHYCAEMTPGTFRGTSYDGVMREIVFNHLALVKQGRAGPDVVVGDSMENLMKPTRFAHLALLLTAAHVKPILAQDAQIDLGPTFAGLTRKNYAERKPAILAEIKKLPLAKDADPQGLARLLDALEDAGETGDESVSEEQQKAMEAAAKGESTLGIPEKVGQEFADKDKGKGFDAEPLKAFLKEKGMDDADIMSAMDLCPKGKDDEGGETEEERQKREAEEAAKKAAPAKDQDPPKKDEEKKDMVDKKAMDEAIKTATEQTTKQVRAQERAIRIALDAVRPYVGELSPALALDSADDVYRHAAKLMNVPNADTIHASALPTLITMMPKAGAQPVERRAGGLGMDAAGAEDYNTRFGTGRIGIIG